MPAGAGSTSFYIERLGVHIASSQELCYVIYQNPLLVLDGFVDDRLIEFIRSELGLSFLAGKLEAWQRSGESQDELPIVILQECCYYNGKGDCGIPPEIGGISQNECGGVPEGDGGLLFPPAAVWDGDLLLQPDSGGLAGQIADGRIYREDLEQYRGGVCRDFLV